MKTIQDLRALTLAEKQMLSDLKRVVLRKAPNATLLLYGSAARGEREPESDYDVLVLLHNRLSRKEEDAIRAAEYELELQHEVVISLIFRSKEQWDSPLARVTPYHKAVDREAVII